jgi:hypothetical protein
MTLAWHTSMTRLPGTIRRFRSWRVHGSRRAFSDLCPGSSNGLPWSVCRRRPRSPVDAMNPFQRRDEFANRVSFEVRNLHDLARKRIVLPG